MRASRCSPCLEMFAEIAESEDASMKFYEQYGEFLVDLMKEGGSVPRPPAGGRSAVAAGAARSSGGGSASATRAGAAAGGRGAAPTHGAAAAHRDYGAVPP